MSSPSMASSHMSPPTEAQSLSWPFSIHSEKFLTWNCTSPPVTTPRVTDRLNTLTRLWNSTSESTAITNRTTSLTYYHWQSSLITMLQMLWQAWPHSMPTRVIILASPSTPNTTSPLPGPETLQLTLTTCTNNSDPTYLMCRKDTQSLQTNIKLHCQTSRLEIKSLLSPITSVLPDPLRNLQDRKSVV